MHEEPVDVAILARLFEAVVHGFLRRGADEQDQILLALRQRAIGSELSACRVSARWASEACTVRTLRPSVSAGQQQAQQVDVAEDAAQVSLLVLDRHAADLRREHAAVGGEEGVGDA